MTYAEIHRLFIDASECATLELYLAECGGSLPAEFYDSDNSTPPEIAASDLLAFVWYHQKLTFRDVFGFSELNQSEFSRTYDIPLRTVQHWYAGEREAPDYVLKLLLLDVINTRFAEP